MKTIKTTTMGVTLATLGLLAASVSGVALAGESIEHAGVKFQVSNKTSAKSEASTYQHAGEKFTNSARLAAKTTAKTYEHAGIKFVGLDK
jgi:Na+/glutamate symporter